MALNTREANAFCRVLDWARGHRVTEAGTVITDEMATDAARLLAASVNRSIHAGPHPERVTLRWTHTVRERLIRHLDPLANGEDEARAVSTVLDMLDRIDREAATAARQEGTR